MSPENFATTSSAQDIIVYVMIATVLVALSPYGVFILRFIFALATGRPLPRITVRRKTTQTSDIEAIVKLEHVTTTRIEEMSGYIAEMQHALAEARTQAEQLLHENNALKNHIRDMEATLNPGQNAQNTTGHDSSKDSDYAILGLPETRRDEIRAAFRKITRESHPDQGGDPERFRKIIAAHERLMSHE